MSLYWERRVSATPLLISAGRNLIDFKKIWSILLNYSMIFSAHKPSHGAVPYVLAGHDQNQLLLLVNEINESHCR